MSKEGSVLLVNVFSLIGKCNKDDGGYKLLIFICSLLNPMHENDDGNYVVHMYLYSTISKKGTHVKGLFCLYSGGW